MCFTRATLPLSYTNTFLPLKLNNNSIPSSYLYSFKISRISNTILKLIMGHSSRPITTPLFLHLQQLSRYTVYTTRLLFVTKKTSRQTDGHTNTCGVDKGKLFHWLLPWTNIGASTQFLINSIRQNVFLFASENKQTNSHSGVNRNLSTHLI